MTIGITALAVLTFALLIWLSPGMRFRISMGALAGSLIGIVATIANAVFGIFTTIGNALLHAIP